MKKKLDMDNIINWWLEKYHDTNIEKVLEQHPTWEKGDHSREFYEAHQVTQEQHDEWYEWFIKAFMKEYRVGRKYTIKNSWVIYLNASPMVREDET